MLAYWAPLLLLSPDIHLRATIMTRRSRAAATTAFVSEAMSATSPILIAWRMESTPPSRRIMLSIGGSDRYAFSADDARTTVPQR